MLNSRFFLPVLLAWVSVACTPSHTADTTAYYARQLGFTDRYDIKRWHNRQFAKDSRILVSLSADTDLEASEVTGAVAKSLGEGFAVVDPSDTRQGVEISRQKAYTAQYQFLLDISRVAWRKAPPPSSAQNQGSATRYADTTRAVTVDPPAAAPAEEPPQQGDEVLKISSIEVEMRILDVATNTTLDKIVLVAAPAWTREHGGTIDQVLGAAVAQLAREMAGP